MKRVLLTLLAFTLAALADVKFRWDPSEDTNIAGYRLHYGPESGVYTQIVDVGFQLHAEIYPDDYKIGQTYFAAATAYNTLGLESDYSNEISFVPRVRAPTGFTMPPMEGIEVIPPSDGGEVE